MTTKENAQYIELCNHTTTLARERDLARPAAFQEACRLHSGLAAVAVYPDGKPVTPGSMVAASQQTEHSELGQALPWSAIMARLGIPTKSAAAKVAK